MLKRRVVAEFIQTCKSLVTIPHTLINRFYLFKKFDKMTTYKLTNCSPALNRPSPIRLGVLVPDPPTALSGPGGDWIYSVPDPGVSAALPDGYMGAYSWYSKFLSFSSRVLIVLSTYPPLVRASPSDSLGTKWCCKGPGLWGREGALFPLTVDKGCWSTTGCCVRSTRLEVMEWRCSRADVLSCNGGGITEDDLCAPLLTSRDSGMTKGQQVTSSTMETAHTISAICWAVCMGETELNLPLWVSSTKRELWGSMHGWNCCTLTWAEHKCGLSTEWEAGCTDIAAACGVGGASERAAKDRGSVVVIERGLQTT